MLKNIMNKMNKMIKKNKKGFTLIELIIVVAIIAILAAIALPKFMTVREDSNVKADIANAKNIQLAVGTLIADGTIIVPDSGTTHFVMGDGSDRANEAGKKLQSVETVKAKKDHAESFAVVINEEGEVVVKIKEESGTTVYPNGFDIYEPK